MLRRDEPAPPLYRALHAALAPGLMGLFRLAVEGREQVPEQGPAVLASNHLSYLDTVLLPAALDRPITFLGKDAYFRGWRRPFFASLGVVPVAREGGAAGQTSLDAGLAALGRGQLLGIYPEGTRSPDGRLHRGKTGAARIALHAGAPIVPVALMGTFDAAPTGRIVPRLRTVTLRFGTPLAPGGRGPSEQGPSDQAVRDRTDELMRRIADLSGQETVDVYAADVKRGRVPSPPWKNR